MGRYLSKNDNKAAVANLSSAQTLAITSGKGGVGKTSVTVNLALALAKRGLKVCIFDADTGLANINILLNLRPKFTIEHVLHGEKSLAEIMLTAPLGVQVIPGATGISEYANLEPLYQQQLIHSLITIERQFDFILIDTCAGIGSSVLHFTQAAQRAVVVITPEPTSLTDSFSLIKVLKGQRYNRRIQVISNMCSDAKQARQVYSRLAGAAKKYLDIKLDYLGLIPFDHSMRTAVRLQEPVTLNANASALGLNFTNLADSICQPWPELDTSHSFSAYWQKLEQSDIDKPSPNMTKVSVPKKRSVEEPASNDRDNIKRASPKYETATAQAPINDMLTNFAAVKSNVSVEDITSLLNQQSWSEAQLETLFSSLKDRLPADTSLLKNHKSQEPSCHPQPPILKHAVYGSRQAAEQKTEPDADVGSDIDAGSDIEIDPDIEIGSDFKIATNIDASLATIQRCACAKPTGTKLREFNQLPPELSQHGTLSAPTFTAQDQLLEALQRRDNSQSIEQFLRKQLISSKIRCLQ